MGLFPSLPLCLKAWPLTHLPCVLSAAVCVVIGWHRNTLLFLLHRGKAGASRLGRVQTTDEGRGDARRHLRHNLHLPAQPLSPCKKTEFHCCLAGGASVCGLWSPSEIGRHDFLQMLFPSFQRLDVNVLCMFTNKETHGNKTC